MLSRLFFSLILAAFIFAGFAMLGPAGAHAADEGPVIKTTLPNDLRVICKQETDTSLVAIDVFVRAGAPQETTTNAGIGSFVAHALFSSTTNNTPEIMTRDINALGGSVSATWHSDWTQIAALTVKDKYKDAIFLLGDTLKNADFDPAAVEDTRTQILSELDNRDSDLFQIAYGNLQKSLYAGTSYARPEGGTAGNISRLTGKICRITTPVSISRKTLSLSWSATSRRTPLFRRSQPISTTFPERGGLLSLSQTRCCHSGRTCLLSVFISRI